jgi:uncharacterized integral membrane protein (TIGR00697 family)
LAKIKIHTNGKYLWFRSLLSTSAGSVLDSILFCSISFAGLIPNNILINMMITQYLLKVGYAILALPIVYTVSSYLKKLDKVDVYDFLTKFNPFSF